jgi:hypothetical protein
MNSLSSSPNNSSSYRSPATAVARANTCFGRRLQKGPVEAEPNNKPIIRNILPFLVLLFFFLP